MAGTPSPQNPIYGPGVAFNGGLANLTVGQFNPPRSVSYRFRAEVTDTISSIGWYSKHAPGYSAGTGGSVVLQIQTDDGSLSHFPSGIILGTVKESNPLAVVFATEIFTVPVPVVAGNLYHVVFSNGDVNPQANYVSVDDTTSFSGRANPLQYLHSDTDLAVLDNMGPGWQLKEAHYPILGVNYSSGYSQGCGYVDALINSGIFTINGTNQVRETFTVTGGDRFVNEVWVTIQKIGTPIAPLNIRLETTGSVPITQVIIPPSSISTVFLTNGWASAIFPTSITLVNGFSYNLVLSDPADIGGNGYQIYPIQDATTTTAFPPATVFSDGHYQNTIDGITWTDFNSSKHFHLCWFLKTFTKQNISTPLLPTTQGYITTPQMVVFSNPAVMPGPLASNTRIAKAGGPIPALNIQVGDTVLVNPA